MDTIDNDAELWEFFQKEIIEELDNGTFYKNKEEISASTSTNLDCQVCGDIASGKHYGVYACNGCKGFFGRTVKNGYLNNSYRCRRFQNCEVNVKHRKQCRSCRMQKCLKVGMKIEAVQGTRDAIGSYQKKKKNSITNLLHEASNTASFIEQNNQSINSVICPDIETTQKYMSKLTSWLENVSYFRELHKEDKITLIKAHAAELFIFWAAYTSQSKTMDSILTLLNIDGISQTTSTFDNAVRERNEKMAQLGRVLSSLKNLKLSQNEFLLLNAIRLFDPDLLILIDRTKICDIRQHLIAELGEFASQSNSNLINFLLLIPTLVDIAKNYFPDCQPNFFTLPIEFN